MLKKALGISVIILVAALVLNNMLGGFEPVQTSIVPFTDSYVYGNEYEGRYDSNELTDLVEEVRAQLSSGDLEGELVIINYFDDRKEKRGDLKQFVGAITSNPSPLNSKSNFSVLKLEWTAKIFEPTFALVTAVFQ